MITKSRPRTNVGRYNGVREVWDEDTAVETPKALARRPNPKRSGTYAKPVQLTLKVGGR